jgi:two-component system, chemotaxis family, response regulator Rcp1
LTGFPKIEETAGRAASGSSWKPSPSGARWGVLVESRLVGCAAKERSPVHPRYGFREPHIWEVVSKTIPLRYGEGSGRTLRILLVEDNPGDVRLVQETLREGPLDIALSVVPDGAAALRYLWGLGEFVGMMAPELILLDFGLPGKDGRQVLAEVRANPRFNTIPVVVFTASTSEDDRLLAYNLRADGYVRKPLTLKSFQDLAAQLDLAR